jgi:hypothetical protein
MIKSIAAYVGAIEVGVQKFMASAPILTKQHIEQLARRNLQSSRDTYLNALKVNMTNFVLVFELDEDDWLANAVEDGAPGWDMKKTHLKGPKVKTSKKGYKYRVIPMEKTKGYKPGTEKGEAYQVKIEEALKSLPTLGVGAKKLQVMMGGKVRETQKINSLDPMLGGFYRTREFQNKEEFHAGKKKPKWQYVMFRVMSENPSQKDKWLHPGVNPNYFLKQTESWIDANFPKILDNMIEKELKDAGF